MAYALDAIWWYANDEEAQITRDAVQRVAIQAGDPRSTHFRTMRHQDMNPEHLMGRRLELLVLAVLGELRGERQLAPHRPRVDVWRRAGDGAGQARRRSS